MSAPILALVDDEPEIRAVYRKLALSIGWQVEEFANGRTFREWMESGNRADFLMLDILMPEQDGIEVIRFLNQQKARLDVLILSGGPGLFVDMAANLGSVEGVNIVDTKVKPLALAEARAILSSALEAGRRVG